MALTLAIDDIVNDSKTKQKKLMKTILTNMASLKSRGAYSDYAPSLDFGNPKSRTLISETLWDLWCYCEEEELPFLNMLVVLKGSGLPSTGVEGWYADKFDTLDRYTDYCELHAKLAELMLQNGIIVLQP